jgi:hypothetical protein
MNNEEMTNDQIKLILKMIVQIIKDSDSKEDAIKKIEELIK